MDDRALDADRAAQDSEDLRLLQAWVDGDEAAGSRLVERNFDVVFRFFSGKVHDPADLVQRTFLACVERRDRLTEVRRFRAYLLGIARNQLLMHLRKADSGKGAIALDSRPLPAGDPSLSGVAARREAHRVLLVALRRLPLDLQIAIELFYWENLSVGEVADVLQTPAGTIKARLFRARKQLQREIAAVAGSPEVEHETVRHFTRWAESVRGHALDDESE